MMPYIELLGYIYIYVLEKTRRPQEKINLQNIKETINLKGMNGNKISQERINLIINLGFKLT